MRRALVLVLACAAGLTASARADDGALPAETLAQLKSVTVLVKVEFTGPGLGKNLPASGSGFLIKAEDETGLVITNHHVVTPPPDTKLTPTGPPTLVFWSGTRKEQAVTAEVVATDPDRDLAVLRVTKFKDLPKPVDLAQKVELLETMSVYIFGFPFGEALSTTKGNPAMTVSRGSVSSLRENEFGEISVVQLDGDLNPGNSGGPVLDKQGRLVGVAVAKVRGGRISMAIPSAELQRMLLGRVGAMGLHPRKVADGKADYDVEASLIDPEGRIKSVSVHYALTESLKEALKPDKNGRWPPLPGAQKVDLKIDKQRALAPVSFTSSVKGRVAYTVQTSYVNGSGETIYTQTSPLTVDFTPTRPVGEVRPTTPGATEPPKSVEVGEARLTVLKLDARGAPPCLLPTEDGKGFYFLNPEGVLRRVRLDGFQAEKEVDLERKAAWLSWSAAGLVVTLPVQQEAWVLDPITFKVKSKLQYPSVTRVASSPKVTYGVAAGRGETVALVDLDGGVIKKEYTRKDFPKAPGVGFEYPAITPDGKYVFTLGDRQIHRFKVEDGALAYEESSQPILQSEPISGINISPDGKYVFVPCGGGNNRGLKDHPDLRPYSTYIYPVENIKRPAFAMEEAGAAFGFDPAAGVIYSQTFEASLVVFGMHGAKKKQFKLPGDLGTGQYMVFPQGRQFLGMTADKIYHVELPVK